MSGLTFDKRELGNLEYSLDREMLATDRRGGYMSTTIVCCNTRKYHGLMVAPIDQSDRTYVLLSSLDETIVQHDQSFNLALHRYNGAYEPRGHKYITDFEYTPTPTITYRVGGVILRKELLWIHKRTQLMIRYTLVDAHSETTLRLRPLLAFRDKHALSKANMEADGRAYPIPYGVKCKLYEGFPWLYMQLSKEEAEFIPAPDWYYNFEYHKEILRGYEAHEDLLTTGYFEFKIKKGESVIFSAATDMMASPETISAVYEASLARRTHKIDFLSCLRHSARQFVIRRPENRTEVIAGYPWFGSFTRDSFIALPGITLTQGYKEDCIEALDTLIRDMHDGDFAGNGSAKVAADAPLWLFYTLQQLEKHIGAKEIWAKYGEVMKSILEAYRRGHGEEVKLHDNGLVWASAEHPLTWMATRVDGQPLTPRRGYPVELQALWYNAVSYTLALAKKQGDKAFVAEWKEAPAKCKASFIQKFWLEEEGYLADYVNYDEVNKYIRCNMVVACGLDFKMLDDSQLVRALMTMRDHLLTPRGLRTLSPRNPHYEPSYREDQRSQDLASRNGSAWVWPLAFYVKACFELSGESFLSDARALLDAFDEELQTKCVGSISERFEGDPSYDPRGGVSHATSVGGLLLINELIEKYEPKRRTRKCAAKRDEAQCEAEAEAKPKRKCVRKSAKK
ncbi:MAG: glycogen debranching enzyme N-terminal domain-containing protein [Alistipes sp.]|nr:glycogen debranching enzyme N-terminal domain-containing protein [Alistipes sp.]